MYPDIILGMDPTEGNVKLQLVIARNKTMVVGEGA